MTSDASKTFYSICPSPKFCSASPDFQPRHLTSSNFHLGTLACREIDRGRATLAEDVSIQPEVASARWPPRCRGTFRRSFCPRCSATGDLKEGFASPRLGQLQERVPRVRHRWVLETLPGLWSFGTVAFLPLHAELSALWPRSRWCCEAEWRTSSRWRTSGARSSSRHRSCHRYSCFGLLIVVVAVAAAVIVVVVFVVVAVVIVGRLLCCPSCSPRSRWFRRRVRCRTVDSRDWLVLWELQVAGFL